MKYETEEQIQRDFRDTVDERLTRPVGQTERVILTRIAFRGEELLIPAPGAGRVDLMIEVADAIHRSNKPVVFGEPINN